MTDPAPGPASASPTPSAESQARRIAGYEIHEKVGQGAMGMVFRARQLTLDRIVALKILPPRLTQDPTFVERFLREARATAKLSHPNIVRIYDVDRSKGGIYYFSMEYLPGGTVRDLVRREGRLTPERALAIVTQVAEALRHAAERGIVHRDVKPDNMMLTADGQVKLADLGLARAQDAASPSATQTGSVTGTPYYMAPEQAEGGVADTRSDLYALGASFYQMLAGVPPYQADSPVGVITQHLTAPVPDPRAAVPDLPAPYAAVVMRLLQKRPADRYQDPAALLNDLAALRDGTPVAAPVVSGRSAPRRIAVAAGAALLLAAAWFAVSLHRRAGRERDATALWEQARVHFEAAPPRLADARALWDQVVQRYPGTRACVLAKRALEDHPLRAPDPVPPRRIPPVPPGGTQDDREALAGSALAQASAMPTGTLAEVSSAIEALRSVRARFEGTEAAGRADVLLRNLQRTHEDLRAREAAEQRRRDLWDAVERQARDLCAEGRFRDAVMRLLAYAQQHRGTPWETRARSMVTDEIVPACERAFVPVEAQARTLAQEGRYDEALAALSSFVEQAGPNIAARAREVSRDIEALRDAAAEEERQRVAADLVRLGTYARVALGYLSVGKLDEAGAVLDSFEGGTSGGLAVRDAARGWVETGRRFWGSLDGQARRGIPLQIGFTAGKAARTVRVEDGILVARVQMGEIVIPEQRLPPERFTPDEWVGFGRDAYRALGASWGDADELFARWVRGDEGGVFGILEAMPRSDRSASLLRDMARGRWGGPPSREAAAAAIEFAGRFAGSDRSAWASRALDDLEGDTLRGGGEQPREIRDEIERLRSRCGESPR